MNTIKFYFLYNVLTNEMLDFKHIRLKSKNDFLQMNYFFKLLFTFDHHCLLKRVDKKKKSQYLPK